MKAEYVASLWERAISTLAAAHETLHHHPDTAANRAYYAAFYAASALFAAEDKFFKKHSGLRSAVHKELVLTGRWSMELGNDYDRLMELREMADYGVLEHATSEKAEASIQKSQGILMAVHDINPTLFPMS
jgi:uncharacterized protein (UPF0332 family)